ncbi:MAG: nucleotidyltransferase domain-containing protein [Promethearchaeota archaeon]|jgi:predicted nucleotidyltransferase
MKIIKGIEGDYIETKESNLFFDVKGLLHPNDRNICFLRFYPHPEGDRIKEGMKYHKVYNLDNRYSLIRSKYPEFLFYSKELDLEVQGVRHQNIKKIYTPREFLQNLGEREDLSKMVQYSKSLCDVLINKGEIPQDSIGITGSAMVGLNKKDSDIDIIVYGTENCYNLQEILPTLFKESKKFRKYNLEEYQAHYDWRVGGSGIQFEDFLKSEQRKLHQGKFHGYDCFIRYIKSPKDWGGNYYDYKYSNIGRIKVKALISNSKDAIFTPCSYKIDNVEMLENYLTSNEIDVKKILEINSFRARFCEQAQEGETVIVEGKLEKVNYKNEIEYYRILLTDQIIDKMLITN